MSLDFPTGLCTMLFLEAMVLDVVRFFYWLSTPLSHENLWRRTKRVAQCRLGCNAEIWLKLCLFASVAKWCIDWLVPNCLERIRILDCRITHFWMEILWLEIWILSSKNGRQGYGYHMVPSPEASSLTVSHIPDERSWFAGLGTSFRGWWCLVTLKQRASTHRYTPSTQ